MILEPAEAHIPVWNSQPVLGCTPNNWPLNEISKGLLRSHNIITAGAVCQLWLSMIRSRPQATQRPVPRSSCSRLGLSLGFCESWGGLSWEEVGSYWPGSVCTQGTLEIETEPSGCARLPDVVWTKCKATWASRRLPQERRQPCLCRGIQWASLAVIAARVYEFWMERLWQYLFLYLLQKQSIRHCNVSQNAHLMPCLQKDRWFWQHMFSSSFYPFFFLGFYVTLTEVKFKYFWKHCLKLLTVTLGMTTTMAND